MKFLGKLFGKDFFVQNRAKLDTNLSVTDFFQTDFVKKIIDENKKTTTLLKPHRSKNEISWKESKFGGNPNLESFSEYPKCTSCDSSLNFVFQVYKTDFPEFYFPGVSNIFQLFRCPNNSCKDSYNEFCDHKMFHYYSKVDCENNNTFLKTANISKDIEAEVPDCYLKPLKTFDFPNFDDFENDDLDIIEQKFGENFLDEFIDKYNAISHTKLWGYPSFTQGPCRPRCNCGKNKEFLFQLSSDDAEDGTEYPPSPDNWSSHGIMIGDVGNIYYFLCKDCGVESIESNWDCY